MLTRLYVDNYKALTNFELKLSGHALLLGPNGSGKSTLLEVLEALRLVLLDGVEVDKVIGDVTLTRWDKRTVQTYELDATDGQCTYHYRLVVDCGFIPTVREESLTVDDKIILSRTASEGELTGTGTAPPSKVVVDEFRSSISMLSNRQGFRGFVSLLKHVLVLSPEPRRMLARTEREDADLDPSLENFASWWRLIWQEQPEPMGTAVKELKASLPGFRSMSIQRTPKDEVRMLTTTWEVGDSDQRTVDFRLHELSDGQRVLIALQCVAAWLSAKGGTLVVDEPDNFLALAEIQPFIRGLIDAPNLQLILASHHPEVLNDLARDHGIRLWRDGNGPIRQERFVMPESSRLTPAEHVTQRLDEKDG